MDSVDCNSCRKSFMIQAQEKKHIETYYRCSQCNERYATFVINADIRKMQCEINWLYETLPTITDQVKYQTKLKEIYEKKNRLELLMKQLKNKIIQKALT